MHQDFTLPTIKKQKRNSQYQTDVSFHELMNTLLQRNHYILFNHHLVTLNRNEPKQPHTRKKSCIRQNMITIITHSCNICLNYHQILYVWKQYSVFINDCT